MQVEKKYHLWIWIILIINIGIYAIEAPSTSLRSTEYLFSIGGFRKDSLSNLTDLYRLITCQFIHSGLIHLVLNMVTFIYVVKELRKYKSYIYMLYIYISGIVGVGVFLGVFAYSNVTYVGNSGGIYSLVFSLLYYEIKEKKKKNKKIKEELDVIVFIIISNILPGASWIMHFSGALMGIITTVVIEYFKDKKGIIS